MVCGLCYRDQADEQAEGFRDDGTRGTGSSGLLKMIDWHKVRVDEWVLNSVCFGAFVIGCSGGPPGVF